MVTVDTLFILCSNTVVGCLDESLQLTWPLHRENKILDVFKFYNLKTETYTKKM